jgi:lysylphosphatidylglycerol synthetase-like protein (DUF2156 family)
VGYPSMPEELGKLQDAAPPEEILLPAPQLSVPATREIQFPVRQADWVRLRRMIARLSDPLPSLAGAGWACVGTAASAIIAYFPWVAAYSQLPFKARQHYSYISPLLVAIAVSCALIAVFIFFASKQVAKVKAASVEDILADMDSIYEPQRRQPPESL